MQKNSPFNEIFSQLKSDMPELQDSAYLLDSMNRQRLQALYLVSQHLNNILDPDRLFEEVIKKITELIKAEHAVIVMRDGDDLNIRIAHNIDDQSQQNALNFSRSVVTRVMNDYRPLYSTNALDDQRFSQFQTIQKLEILSFISVPILINGEAIGTIYVDNRRLADVFSEGDVEFLQAFANLLGIAIRNSMAYHQVEELNRSLEKKVKERTAKLHKTIEELKNAQAQLVQSEKMAGLGRLIAGFMHEFNNPINFIYSNLPYLEQYSRNLLAMIDELLPQISEEERAELQKEWDLNYIRNDLSKLIEGIQEGAQRSRQIIEDLRNFSGANGRSAGRINWNENLQMIRKIFLERIKKPVEIELTGGENLFIEGTRAELNQALMNLLQNAADAGANRIRISSQKKGKRLRCSIEDNGAGISKKELNKIFDPFYTTKEVGRGMGLGLSIVYSTIEFHRGKIQVSSEMGKGTTFTIDLPLIS